MVAGDTGHIDPPNVGMTRRTDVLTYSADSDDPSNVEFIAVDFYIYPMDINDIDFQLLLRHEFKGSISFRFYYYDFEDELWRNYTSTTIGTVNGGIWYEEKRAWSLNQNAKDPLADRVHIQIRIAKRNDNYPPQHGNYILEWFERDDSQVSGFEFIDSVVQPYTHYVPGYTFIESVQANREHDFPRFNSRPFLQTKPTPPDPDPDFTAIVAGNVTKLGVPFSGELTVLSVEDVPKVVGHAVSDPTTGNYSVDVWPWDGYVLVCLAPDYGMDFQPLFTLSQGQIVHPTVPNEYVYAADNDGQLGATEPDWPSDGSNVVSGAVTLIAQPLHRPLINGFLKPVITPIPPA